MVKVAQQWLPADPVAVYHGQSRGPDGTVWVYPRLHTGGGLVVEVHLDRPDGVVIWRSPVAHRAEAASVVQELRDLVSRQGVDAVEREIAALAPRGSVVVHHRPWERYRTGYARLDQGAETPLCSRIWALPGRHCVVAAWGPRSLDRPSVPESAAAMDIIIEPHETIHVRLRSWPGDDLVPGRRLVHQCPVPGVPLLGSSSHRAPL